MTKGRTTRHLFTILGRIVTSWGGLSQVTGEKRTCRNGKGWAGLNRQLTSQRATHVTPVRVAQPPSKKRSVLPSQDELQRVHHQLGPWGYFLLCTITEEPMQTVSLSQ